MNIKTLAALVLSFNLVACSDNNDNIEVVAGDAIVATRAADYSSGAHAGLQRNDDGSYALQNNLVPTISDITVAAYGSNFYRIERYSGENISKFSFQNPDTPIWQYSTKDNSTDEVSSNPQTIVFASETKAYVMRYGKAEAWIVNPSAETEEDFKIGVLDLSGYGADDGIPEMHNAVIANGKLFISLQRLKDFNPDPDNLAYVAVFDIATDTEIDTDTTDDSGNLKGIQLDIQNPNSDMIYLAEDNSIYIAGTGDYYAAYNGGVEKINVSNYAKTLVLDDEQMVNGEMLAPYGRISGLAIKSSTVAYFIGYDGYDANWFSINTVYGFNPSTGLVTTIDNSAISDKVIPSISLDNVGDLWVSTYDVENQESSIRIISSVDDSEIDSIITALVPEKVVFE